MESVGKGQHRRGSRSKKKKKISKQDSADSNLDVPSPGVCPPPENKQCTTPEKSIEDEDKLEKDVKAVVEELIKAVEAQLDGDKEPEAEYRNGKGRRGAKRRVSYDIVFKATVLKDLKRGRTRPVDVAERHKIHKSLVTKWLKQEKEIMEAASKDHKKALKRRRPKSTKKKRDKI